MLTKKQQKLLVHINECLQKDGVAPSFEEMKQFLGLHSKSGVHRLIKGLEERGFLRRLPHRARAMEVIKVPQDSGATPDRKQQDSGTPKNVILRNFNTDKKNEVFRSHINRSVDLPLLGRIAAGTPNEALQDTNQFVDVPTSMVGRQNCYALEIAGDSMMNAGILEGDIAIIERTTSAENGQIVVALIDDHEATLKRLRKRGASIALEPANPAYETRIFGPDQVKVQGRMVGLIRNYPS